MEHKENSLADSFRHAIDGIGSVIPAMLSLSMSGFGISEQIMIP